jgi:hypothetical protein
VAPPQILDFFRETEFQLGIKKNLLASLTAKHDLYITPFLRDVKCIGGAEVLIFSRRA